MTPAETHARKCHCGKYAKKHQSDESGCRNVCGVHGRKNATEGAQYVCRGCGEHGASLRVFGVYQTVWDAGDWHRACHDSARDARTQP